MGAEASGGHPAGAPVGGGGCHRPGGLRPGTRQAAAPGPGPGPVRRRDPEDPPALRRIPGRGGEPDLRPAGTGRGHRFCPGLGQPGQIRPEGDHPFRPPLGAAQGRPGANPGEERAVSGPVVGQGQRCGGEKPGHLHPGGAQGRKRAPLSSGRGKGAGRTDGSHQGLCR